MSLILAGGFLVTACGAAASSDAKGATGPSSRTVTLAVVRCPTTFAVAQPNSPAPTPTRATATVPGRDRTSLRIYTDARGTIQLLAPASWTCRANFGADGSGGLVVYPKTESPPPESWEASWHFQRSSGLIAISAIETGGSSVQAAAQACGFFPAATKVTKQDLGHGCVKRPKDETASATVNGAIEFVDPSGIAGTGRPSGGTNSALGVVTYSTSNSPGSYLFTCVLKKTEDNICAAGGSDFAYRY